MRAFVTGATGFVGTHVARALLREGAAVRVLARPGSDRRNLADLDVEVVQGDLLEPEPLPGLLAGCDELYHVAAFYSTRPKDGPTMYRVNVEGTRNLLEAALAAGVGRVVHTSTIGTIGRPEDGSLPTEASPFNLWATASDYAKSKVLGEQAALELAERGLPVVVVNPCAPVGPRDVKPTSTGQRIVDYLQGKQPSFVSGGINFVSVADVAAGHLLAARKGQPGQRYILGHAQGNLSLADFFALMKRVSGVTLAASRRRPLVALRARLRSRWRPPRQGQQPMALTCDPSRAIRELGLPQTPLAEAFAEAVRWFRENGYVRS